METRLRIKIYHKNISFVNWNCCCSNLIQESNRQHCQIPWNLFLGLYWAFFQFSCWRQVQYKSVCQCWIYATVPYQLLTGKWKLKNVCFNKYYLIWQNNWFGSTHLPTKSLSELCALGTIFSSSGSIQVKKQREKKRKILTYVAILLSSSSIKLGWDQLLVICHNISWLLLKIK